MIPLNLRVRLFAMDSRVERRGLKEIPLVTVVDLLRARTMGWKKAFYFIQQLQQYRRNLHASHWSGLTTFYPRSTYLYYYYLLFWWASYCGVSEQLLTAPDRSLVAELFIRYFVEIDLLVDDDRSKSQLDKPAHLKNWPSVRAILSELLTQIWRSGVASQEKRALCHRIWCFRRDCLSVCVSSMANANHTFGSVMFEKDSTAGGLFRVWAAILGTLYPYGIPPRIASSSHEILGKIAIATQFIDDMIDLPVDCASHTSNLFYELARETLSEIKAIDTYLTLTTWQHLDWAWAQQYAPVTCKRAADLVEGILDQIHEISLKPEYTSELCQLIRSIARASFGVTHF